MLKSTTFTAGPPKVLHYGNELAINNITYYEFNKIDLKANKFNPLECPPWTKKDGKFTSGLLPFPPSPLSFESKVRAAPHPPASESLSRCVVRASPCWGR